MTMPTPNHPDDEVLAALAASEPDVVADARLAAHIGSCEQCTRVVDELRDLRSALADLPDIPPSRPLRFLPPVAETPASRVRGGWIGLARWVTTPLMGAAAVLILVGALGTAVNSGVGAGGAASLSKEGAAAASAAASTTSDAQHPVAGSVSAAPGQLGGSSATPYAADASGRNTFDNGSTTQATPAPGSRTSTGAGSTRPPFEWLLGGGVVLLALTLLARAYLRRRDPPEPA
jgi:hypothetical protein